MIVVKLNEPDFEYDIHSLVKAFYPGEDVLVSAEEKEAREEVRLRLEIDFIRDPSDKIEFRLFPQKDTVLIPGVVPDVDFSDRRETRNRLKRGLYVFLAEYTGQELPWGTLTGIRPTKIPMELLECGADHAKIVSYMETTYLASRGKIDLSIEVAERELSILKKIDYARGYSLYIGIPFCPSTCLYCSFTSYPISAWEDRVDDYLDALEREIRWTGKRFADRQLHSIYIGGGTPTTLSPAQLDRLLSMTEQNFDFSHLAEFTVEAGRPDSITREKLEVLRAHGIRRISINPQTMKQETLDLIGRRHTVEQIEEKYRLARDMGFENINMDLIVGLPEETLSDVEHTMQRITSLAPDNLTVHSLAVKRAARLRMQREDYEGLHMENTWETIALTAEYARRAGLFPYYLYRQKNMAGNFENVGYARPGCEGIYNILIMEEKQTIMALGAGATSKVVLPQENGAVRIERTGNVKDLKNYLERVDEMIARKEALLEKNGM